MQEEFDKYAEEDDEDYEDVFGKIGPTCTLTQILMGLKADLVFASHRPADADSTTAHEVVEQIMGMFRCRPDQFALTVPSLARGRFGRRRSIR